MRGKKRDALGPLTRSEVRDRFRRTLDGNRWKKIKGFHVFRHSFASNLAAAGVDQRIIDEWMGHQTEEMRRRRSAVKPATHVTIRSPRATPWAIGGGHATSPSC
jgi:integrase